MVIKDFYLIVCIHIHRDTSSIVKAVKSVSSDEDDEVAMNFLEKSTSKIDDLVCSILTLIKHWLISVYRDA